MVRKKERKIEVSKWKRKNIIRKKERKKERKEKKDRRKKMKES